MESNLSQSGPNYRSIHELRLYIKRVCSIESIYTCNAAEANSLVDNADDDDVDQRNGIQSNLDL